MDSDEGAAPNADSALAGESVAVWSNPLMKIVLDHSILSNIVAFPFKPAGEAQERPYLSFTFRGDPLFQPKSDLERIAKSLDGEITIDLTGPSFILINGVTEYRVLEKNRFLVDMYIPLLSFAAAPFHGANLPLRWDVASYSATANAHAWAASLSRTFATRESCREFHGEGTVLPEFEPEPGNSIRPD